ncbi:MAG: HEAT repeat domain-containing protein [Candidatus Aminicenantes bacterium]|nr:HEAT repeat domain-containing protein [Candidatus Aminicenantes bacterium]
MTKQKIKPLFFVMLAFGLLFRIGCPLLTSSPAPQTLKVMVITGQNNHDWKTSSPILKQILENTRLFEVDVATSPPRKGDMDSFNPNFALYQLVVLDYNGDSWSVRTQRAFINYVKAGGGVVVYHAANNAFPGWKEYNEIIGLGGWENRNETSGPYIYWKDGEVVRDSSPGRGGYHGYQHEFLVINRDTSHPITRGLPQKWMHAKDELYSLLRGPAKNLHVLTTAYSDPEQSGTGRDEPVLFTIEYGKGRIFHTVLGHAGGEIPPPAMECVGFIVTFQRGAEWAATGKVTQEVPGDFPVLDKDVSAPGDIRRWEGFRPPSLKTILQDAATFEYGQNKEILSQLRDYIQSHRDSPESRQHCEEQLLSLLNSSATLAAKMTVCRHLRMIGSEMSVPVLEKMLIHKDTSDMARYALEKIPGDSVDNVLIKGLAKSDGNMRIGIISSLGQRKVPDSVPALGKLIHDSDSATAIAAAAALGQVTNPEAARVLSKAMNKTKGQLKTQVAASLLKCAEQFHAQKNLKTASGIYNKVLAVKIPVLLRQAAMKGKISTAKGDGGKIIIDVLKSRKSEMHSPAISMVRDIFDESTIQQVCVLFPELPVTSQAHLLPVLSHYNEPSVLQMVIKTTESKESSVRIAALKALGKLGDTSTLDLLTQHAAKADGEEQTAARNSLWGLKGVDTDQTIIVNLIRKPDPAIQLELIQSIGERRINEGKSLLFDKTRSSNPKNRTAAIKALKEIAAPDDLPRLLNILLRVKSEKDRQEIQNTIAAIASKIPRQNRRANAVSNKLESVETVKDRCALYRVLGKIGVNSTLPLIRKALTEDNGNIHDAAVRALADWPNDTPMDDLLQIAGRSTSTVHQVLALRAYVRMIEMDRYRSPEGAARSLKEALALSSRPEEKIMILGALPRFACKETLELAESLLQEDEVKAEAELAVGKIKKRLEK